MAAVDVQLHKGFEKIGSLSNDDGDGNDNAAKQSLCTCVLHFGTFLCRPLQNNNVK